MSRAVRTEVRALAVFSLVVAAGCVTTYEPTPDSAYSRSGARTAQPDLHLELPALAMPVVIPIQGADNQEDQLLRAVFHGLVQRMSEAAAERDFTHLDALIASCDRPTLPADMKAQLQGFRGVSKGLRFEDYARQNTRLVVGAAADEPPADPAHAGAAAGTVPPLGQSIHIDAQLPAPPFPVTLGGRDDSDPIGFAVSIVITDTFVDGGSPSSRTQHFVWLPQRCELKGDGLLSLPIEVDLPAGDAVSREVLVRVDLMPGYVECDGVRAPVQRTSIGECSLTQHPAGFAKLAVAPLAELQQALQAFAPRNFARAYLAATLTAGDDRQQAIRLLIEQVRFGGPDQSLVAMAALHAITSEDLAIGDRDAWLTWWGKRRP